MSENGREIKVGSIIHLENGAPRGGYLDVRGRVIEKSVLENWDDLHILGFVFTHVLENRLGSGSWEILSASGMSIGDPLKYGDKVYLRNMYSGAEYLDTFEWVDRIKPFKDYPMKIGVFTSNDPKRDGGVSGTWTIKWPADKREGDQLVEGNSIYLENDFPDAGFLRTYGKVTEHEMFKEYDGQRKFVFTGFPLGPDDVSHTWTVSLSSSSKNLYYLWGNLAGKWLDFGALKIDGTLKKSLVSLKISSKDEKISSEDEDNVLVGKAAYSGEGVADFEARWIEKNCYEVTHELNGKVSERHPNGRWILGGRDHKMIDRFDITSDDNGRSFTGELQYKDEDTVFPIKGFQPSTRTFNKSPQAMQYDFFEPALWETRIRRISNALETAVAELDDVLLTIGGFSIEKLAQLINNAGGNSYIYLAKDYISKGGKDTKEDDYTPQYWQLLQQSGSVKDLFEESQNTLQHEDHTISAEYDHLNEKLLDLLEIPFPPVSTEKSPDALDVEFQIKQLLNIYTLWRNMDEFWTLFSNTSIDWFKKLSDAAIMPPVHRIRECIRQFTVDFEIIQSAIQQRRWTKPTHERASGNAQAGSLVITDKLASMALAPFQHLLADSSNIIPITYFTKKIHVRDLPYTDRFVFVGLTYDLTSSISQLLQTEEPVKEVEIPPFELMAIPHEVGHFIYHYPKLIEGKSFADMSEEFKAHPYYHWCEEIFCDLYGCLVAGPFSVLGLQSLLTTNDTERMIMDDEEHPTPIFRPYFLSEMLRVLSDQEPERYDFAETALLLDANWTAILERLGFVIEDVFNGRPAQIRLPSKTEEHLESFTNINIEKALENVRLIIETFTQALPLPTNAKLNLRPSDGDDDLSAIIPWCHKHESLADYSQALKELVGQRITRESVTHLHLSKKYQLKTEMPKATTPTLEKDNVEIDSTLFLDILEGWQDSGPHGFGGH